MQRPLFRIDVGRISLQLRLLPSLSSQPTDESSDGIQFSDMPTPAVIYTEPFESDFEPIGFHIR